MDRRKQYLRDTFSRIADALYDEGFLEGGRKRVTIIPAEPGSPHEAMFMLESCQGDLFPVTVFDVGDSGVVHSIGFKQDQLAVFTELAMAPKACSDDCRCKAVTRTVRLKKEDQPVTV